MAGREVSLCRHPPALPEKNPSAAPARRAETLAQPRRAAPRNRDWRLPGWGRRAWRPRSTAHRESGLSICGQTHCRAPTKPRLVLIATSLPISAVGFRPKTFSVVAAERTSRYFPAAVLRDLYVPSNYGESVISATALGLSGLGLALWPRLLLHHGPAHRTRLRHSGCVRLGSLRPDVTFVRPDGLFSSRRVSGVFYSIHVICMFSCIVQEGDWRSPRNSP